nr:hypothetical protein Iba_chr04aCG22160 [Ipomoea batatas]
MEALRIMAGAILMMGILGVGQARTNSLKGGQDEPDHVQWPLHGHLKTVLRAGQPKPRGTGQRSALRKLGRGN